MRALFPLVGRAPPRASCPLFQPYVPARHVPLRPDSADRAEGRLLGISAKKGWGFRVSARVQGVRVQGSVINSKDEARNRYAAIARVLPHRQSCTLVCLSDPEKPGRRALVWTEWNPGSRSSPLSWSFSFRSKQTVFLGCEKPHDVSVRQDRRSRLSCTPRRNILKAKPRHFRPSCCFCLKLQLQDRELKSGNWRPPVRARPERGSKRQKSSISGMRIVFWDKGASCHQSRLQSRGWRVGQTRPGQRR